MATAVEAPPAPLPDVSGPSSSTETADPAEVLGDARPADVDPLLEEADCGAGGAAGSRREALKTAYDELTFPSYPTSAAGVEEPFNLPKGFIDAESPLSARKWWAAPRGAARSWGGSAGRAGRGAVGGGGCGARRGGRRGSPPVPSPAPR